MADFGWEPPRYRNLDNGRYVSRRTVRSLMERGIEARNDNNISPLVDALYAGTIDEDRFESDMRENIKRASLSAYELAFGGKNAMRQSDYGRLGGLLNVQYNRFLSKFVDDIKSGNLTQAQVDMRARMYIKRTRGVYERAFSIVATKSGYREVIWNLVAEKNCSDCPNFSLMGYQDVSPWPFRIGARLAFPANGLTICRVNCRCYLSYRNARGRTI